MLLAVISSRVILYKYWLRVISTMPKHFLSITDLTKDELTKVLARAADLQRGAKSVQGTNPKFALIFQKPSLRTKVSFTVAIAELGGHATFFGPEEIGLGSRESVKDIAKTLERYVDCIIARVYKHETLVELASVASVPIVNALSDLEHPCQTVGDLLTIQEYQGSLQGSSIAFIGDGNNVASSLAMGCALMDIKFTLVCPKGYELPKAIVQSIENIAGISIGSITTTQDLLATVASSDVIYTDVWISMGSEAETNQRLQDFQEFQVTNSLLDTAKKETIFMHCMPAQPSREIEAGILDHPKSVVYRQAENRLYAQQSILERILK